MVGALSPDSKRRSGYGIANTEAVLTPRRAIRRAKSKTWIALYGPRERKCNTHILERLCGPKNRSVYNAPRSFCSPGIADQMTMVRNSTRERKNYLVLGCKPWNRRLFDESVQMLPGRWAYLDSAKLLTLDFVRKLSPRYIFFLHWSWRVPEQIVKRFECVCFHMTDVPFGRGGSPLQNLIVRGHRETRLTALRMTEEFDAGPVYMKEPLSIEGGAEEIYLRAGRLSAKMIERIVREEMKPVPQEGMAVNFKRRTPPESEAGDFSSLEALYDFIRMLDADGYPRAFLQHRGMRFEFSRPALYDGRIVADVKITRADDGKEPRK
jgi:methionyl-tRNA formyltransferase